MIFSYFVFVNTTRITSGRITKKARKSVFTILQIYRRLYQRFKGAYPKKSGSKQVKYPKVQLTVMIK
jgi:hypothetical protein